MSKEEQAEFNRKLLIGFMGFCITCAVALPFIYIYGG